MEITAYSKKYALLKEDQKRTSLFTVKLDQVTQKKQFQLQHTGKDTHLM